MSNNLRSSVIRLAHANPSLRPHLLPLLKIGYNPSNPDNLSSRGVSPAQRAKNLDRINNEDAAANKAEARKPKPVTQEDHDNAEKLIHDEETGKVTKGHKDRDDARAQESEKKKKHEQSPEGVREKDKADKGKTLKQNRIKNLKSKGDKATDREKAEVEDYDKEEADETAKAEKSKSDSASEKDRDKAEHERAKETAKNKFKAYKEEHPLTKKTVGDFFKGLFGKKASLRSRTIRLAHANPELRPHLLPLLKVAGQPDYLPKGGMDSFKAFEKLVKDLPDDAPKKDSIEESLKELMSAAGKLYQSERNKPQIDNVRAAARTLKTLLRQLKSSEGTDAMAVLDKAIKAHESVSV